jgi:hypothetical protein
VTWAQSWPEPTPQKPAANREKPRPIPTETGYLYIHRVPETASVVILNSAKKYQHGVSLLPGNYVIAVSEKGFKTQQFSVEIVSGRKEIKTVKLLPLTAKTPPPQPKSESPEIKALIDKLDSAKPQSIREAARTIHRRYAQNEQLVQAASKAIEKGYRQSSNDRLRVDAKTWLCKIIGRSGFKQYTPILERVSQEATNRKLKKYALSSLRMLQ